MWPVGSLNTSTDEISIRCGVRSYGLMSVCVGWLCDSDSDGEIVEEEMPSFLEDVEAVPDTPVSAATLG